MSRFIPGTSAERPGDVADLLHAVTRRIRREAQQELAPLGLTPALTRALRILGRYEGPTRMSTLAEALHIARRSATTVVDALVARGLVAREDDPTDRRAVLVQLTSSGTEHLAAIDGLRRAAAGRLLRALSPAEQRQLQQLLTQLLQA